MSYIKGNIRWSIQLCDEALVQFKGLLESDPAEAATITVVLKELEDDEELEKHLTTDGYQTENYKICYVRLYVIKGIGVLWRLSVNAECNAVFTPMDVRLVYGTDYQSKVFKVIDIMPRGVDYGDNDPEYQKRIIELYKKYFSA